MRVLELKRYLDSLFPKVTFYANTRDKTNPKCVAIYTQGNAPAVVAIGEESSFSVLPVNILVHWSEDSDACESVAQELYKTLKNLKDTLIPAGYPNATATDPDAVLGAASGQRRIILVKMLDSNPVDLSRDANNICEMSIRANIFYEREVI